MEIETTAEPVVDTVVEPTETPTEATATETPVEASTEATPTTPESEWKASFKYKVKDSEHDMPDWVHPLVKDADTEKEMKTLFSRGHGIEDIKTERQTLRDELTEVRDSKESIDQSLNTLSEYVQKGDMKSFFEALQIPKDLVMKYAVEELKYSEMSPEQRSKIDNDRQVNQQLQELQYQNQTLQQQSEQARVSQKQFELSNAISRPEVATTAQTFDARNGAGAFQREVVNQGVLAFHTEGVELTTDQAVGKVLGLLGALTPADPAVATPNVVPGQATTAKPVIPNMQSGGGSPVRSVPRSLEDLRKLADGMGVRP